jgi:hypothetical protein
MCPCRVSFVLQPSVIMQLRHELMEIPRPPPDSVPTKPLVRSSLLYRDRIHL